MYLTSPAGRLAGGLAMAVPAAIAALVVAGPAAAATAAQAIAKVSVVHGIPGQPVDVYVNGEKTLDSFQPATIAGPLDLPEGTYDIALTKPGEPIANAILTLDDAQVPGGANLSLVAHLDADGTPVLTAFVNDTSRLAAGKARLIVRHTAAAPAVDVRANATPVFTNLTNPNEAKADVAAGTVSADVVLAGTATVVLGPADVDLAEGSATIVYAIGSAEADSLSLVVQTITGLQTAPGGVPAGSGGLLRTGAGWWWYGLLAVAVVLLVGGAARLALRTARG